MSTGRELQPELLARGDRNSYRWRIFGIYYNDWRNVLKTDHR
jgi:hypothetical protein